MKITNLKQQIKNPERVSVFVDNKYSFSLTLDQIVELKIKNNLEVTEAELKKFKKHSDDGKLRARAMEWVMNRPHSTREFYDYMRRKKVDQELAEKLELEFTTKGYLNDAYFAKWFIELKSRANKSNRAITSELFKKGIGREVMDEVMLGDEDSEVARLNEQIAKKSKQSKYRDDPTKLIRYLTSQGFSYSLIKQQLNLTIPED